ncbi:hypothetical protein GCM10011515_22550 [Tsuneonella deserti]|uniref:Transglycosylase associated protein n=1 Tax=Tsuneonella deserti TaxID=2035528 RepID=A0ABQ1SD34_9SPHN|nr:GlsB/YeaQ/YmgE family stress response membrane protein [Tsuneonella deserti]GGE02385.1 hypothetical protein GCM10011515_22550 [Tsuneonella deserti]
MGFVVLIALGSILGWLASIISRGDDGQSIALNVGIGVLGALVVGAFASSGSLLVGLSAEALLIALAGATAVLLAFNLAWARRAS